MLMLAGLIGCASEPPPRLAPFPAPPEGAQCLASLNREDALFTSVPTPKAGNAACVVATPVRATRLGAMLTPATIMDCGLATIIARFTSEVVEPEAKAILNQKVTALRNYGAFSCRETSSGRHRLSQHAYGKAFDLSGFTLADGSRVAVAADWDDDGPKGRFLRKIARRACDYFNLVLTPESNSEHHDHLHLDIGPYRACEAPN